MLYICVWVRTGVCVCVSVQRSVGFRMPSSLSLARAVSPLVTWELLHWISVCLTGYKQGTALDFHTPGSSAHSATHTHTHMHIHTPTHTKWCVPLCFPSLKPYILGQEKHTNNNRAGTIVLFCLLFAPFFCIPLAFFHLFLSLIAQFYSHPHVCFSLFHYLWLWLISALKYPQTSSLFFVYSFLWKYRIFFFLSFFQTALQSWFLGLIHHEIAAFNKINSDNRNGNKIHRCTICGSNTKSICVPLYLLVSWQLFKKVIWLAS